MSDLYWHNGLLDNLADALDKVNEEGLSWSFDHVNYELTIHDPEDGGRCLYRVFNSKRGVDWERVYDG